MAPVWSFVKWDVLKGFMIFTVTVGRCSVAALCGADTDDSAQDRLRVQCLAQGHVNMGGDYRTQEGTSLLCVTEHCQTGNNNNPIKKHIADYLLMA